MGYATTEVLAINFIPSATVLANNIPVASNVGTTYTKVKEIKLINSIYPESRFRFIFDLRTHTNPVLAYGKIYRNGVAIGTEQVTANNAFVTMTEDINIGGWNINDTIELWIKNQSAMVPNETFVQNFQICGSETNFINTLE